VEKKKAIKNKWEKIYRYDQLKISFIKVEGVAPLKQAKLCAKNKTVMITI
jgi:hypothetical protein